MQTSYNKGGGLIQKFIKSIEQVTNIIQVNALTEYDIKRMDGLEN